MPRMRNQDGFTLIEFLMAMAVFSFMLAIIVTGFITVVRLHNQSVAAGNIQDNAQNAVALIEREVRDADIAVPVDSAGVVKPSSRILCLDGNRIITETSITGGKILEYQATSCKSPGSAEGITTGVGSYGIMFTNTASGATRPSINFTVTLGPSDPTLVSGADAAATCIGHASDKQFCAITTVNGSAVPRGLGGQK